MRLNSLDLESIRLNGANISEAHFNQELVFSSDPVYVSSGLTAPLQGDNTNNMSQTNDV